MFHSNQRSKNLNQKSNETLSGTPITRLSKCLSKTSFKNDNGKNQLASLPAVFDDNANLEAPTTTIPLLESHELLTREPSNTSSGYYSTATLSASPSYEPKHNIISSLSHKKFGSVNITDALLKKTKSCTRSWLAKRNLKCGGWPHISGISFRATSFPLQIDSNSCPAALTYDITHDEYNRKLSLPPLCTVSSASSSTLEKLSRRESFILDSTTKSHTSSDDKQTQEVEIELDSTLPLDDCMSENDEKPMDMIPIMGKRTAGILRHHSTPMPFTDRKYLENVCAFSPVDGRPNKDFSPQGIKTPPTNFKKTKSCLDSVNNFSIHLDDKREFALPIIDRTASGLHCVSTDIVAELVKGSEKTRNINYVIVDCRFPYEYEGGHIKEALNIFTHGDLVHEIFNRVPAQRPPDSPGPPCLLGDDLARRLAIAHRETSSAPTEMICDSDSDDSYLTNEASELESEILGAEESNTEPSKLEKNNDVNENTSLEFGSQDSSFVLIFHCEFSSQRAPDLATFLRKLDRASNYHRYPFLFFPEIYIMKGGYAAFYQKFPEFCTPTSYVKMVHRDYRSHLRLYKRLTHRVNSACTACIRTKHCELGQLDPPVFEFDSFVQIQNAKINLGSFEHGSPASDNLLSNSSISEDKENVSVYGIQSPLSHDGADLNKKRDDNSLNLAEIVVRVGRQVVESVSCFADPATSEAARALFQYKQRVLIKRLDQIQGPEPARNLKRAKTTTILEMRKAFRPNIAFGLSDSDEGSCLERLPRSESNDS